MTEDPGAPVAVANVESEIEAGAIITALEAEGIRARMVGEFTAGFRAEAPGSVSVVVRQEDAARATEVLDKLNG